jgi:hypothetical protein
MENNVVGWGRLTCIYLSCKVKEFHVYVEELCRNPSLGLMTKASAYKGAGQEGSPKITYHAPMSARECEGMNRHTPK